MDLATRTVRLVHLFTHVGRRSIAFTWQKNWGFLPDDDGGLRMLYSTLPASIVLRLPPGALRSAMPQFERATQLTPAAYEVFTLCRGFPWCSSNLSRLLWDCRAMQ